VNYVLYTLKAAYREFGVLGSDQENCLSLFWNSEKKEPVLALKGHFGRGNRPDKEFCGWLRNTYAWETLD